MPKHSTLRSQLKSHTSSSVGTTRAIKKGQPWTEEEHLNFLVGLAKVGKGNWRLISRYYVPTRTPTQVASHAQKHFIRQSGVTKRKSRFTMIEQAVSAAGILPLVSPPGSTSSLSPPNTPPPAHVHGPATPTIPDALPPALCKPKPRHADPVQLHKLHEHLQSQRAALPSMQLSSRSAFTAPRA